MIMFKWTNQLSTWGRVLFETLVVAQLVKKLSPFYGARRFPIVFTTASHSSLTWSHMNHVHTLPNYFSKIYSNIISPSTPRSSEWFIPLGLSTKILYTFITSPMRATFPANLSPSNADVTDVWSYTSTHPYVFMARCLIKQRENFTVYLSVRGKWSELHRFQAYTFLKSYMGYFYICTACLSLGGWGEDNSTKADPAQSRQLPTCFRAICGHDVKRWRLWHLLICPVKVKLYVHTYQAVKTYGGVEVKLHKLSI